MRLFGSNALPVPENAVPTASIEIGSFPVRRDRQYGRRQPLDFMIGSNCGLEAPNIIPPLALRPTPHPCASERLHNIGRVIISARCTLKPELKFVCSSENLLYVLPLPHVGV